MKLEEVKRKFSEMFGYEGKTRSFYAPGRVNLIGEHTDYNGGYVFPCALSFGTYAVARKRNDNIVRLASTNFDLKVKVDVNKIVYDKKDDWGNFPKGVIKEFQNKGFRIGGFDVLYDGNIPNGAGLSSSASIELVTSVMLKALFDCDIDMIEMVKLSQRAENKFVGVNCGIMDQFAVGMGKRDNAMLLNCGTLEYKYVPIKLTGYKLLISNTNKKRGLADSKYNERRSQCEKAVWYLNKKLDIKQLADIDVRTFEKYKYLIEDNVVEKRAEHVIYEIKRTTDAVSKLEGGDILGFGKLMNESHISLRDLYEVTGPELDSLAKEAWKIHGVAGSRMTGAGFGGCTVTIIKEDAVDEFKEKVGENYKRETGLTADFYIAEIGDGAREIE
ncbi:MAG: galactokinase [Clostridiales bacterium]|nr:galactokinase [Clostridiales bacterium]HBM80075.1 galactokinase [Clostridiaceae bacterium]